MPRGVKHTDTELTFTEEVLKFSVGENIYARYEKVGDCPECGAGCYICKSHPIRADTMLGKHLAVLVVRGPGHAQAYCQEHNPTKGMGHPGIPANQDIPGESYAAMVRTN